MLATDKGDLARTRGPDGRDTLTVNAPREKTLNGKKLTMCAKARRAGAKKMVDIAIEDILRAASDARTKGGAREAYEKLDWWCASRTDTQLSDLCLPQYGVLVRALHQGETTRLTERNP